MSAWFRNGTRWSASTILAAYGSVVLLAGLSLQQRGDLGLVPGPCADAVCVAWVMPGSYSWHGGARAGMRIESLIAGPASSAERPAPWVEAQLVRPDGSMFPVRVSKGSITLPTALVTLWLTGGLFALLGAAVLMRGPEAPPARLFALFAGFTAIALAVAPAAGGPHPAWSLVVQFLSLLALAASLPAFATAFVGGWRGSLISLRLFWLAGMAIMVSYLASLLNAGLYGAARAGLLLYLAAGVAGALLVLAGAALRRRNRRSAGDARLALSGIACGTLPFIGLTAIPQATAQDDLVPAYITASLWSAIPLTFTYAILRHQLLGIRRLVHRGMVYGLTAVILLAAIYLFVASAQPLLDRFSSIPPPAVTAIALVLGVLTFHWLQRAVRSFVDRFLDPHGVDPETLLRGMRHDLLGSDRAEDVVNAMVNRLRDSLHLESIVLLLGTNPATLQVAASAGPRAKEACSFLRSRLTGFVSRRESLTELRWNSDVLLVARLETGIDTLGFLVAGPKDQGEIFLREERRLIETVTPILALAIRETSLLSELREVSGRLTSVQEAERARIASDLHDGPLQKALFLAGVTEAPLRDREGVARDLAVELRELCARLRPAILDDLGLVAALEWLLEQTAQGFRVTPSLTLRGMTEEDRLAPHAELALFRVTQEAVNNALKHGRARSIHVSLTRTGDAVQLAVVDDGRGLERTGDIGGGLGLPGMRERLRQVGGSVSVGSHGAGTVVTASIPCSVH